MSYCHYRVLHHDKLSSPRNCATSGAGLTAIASGHAHRDDLRRGALCETYVLAYNGEESVQLEEKLWAIPVGKLIE